MRSQGDRTRFRAPGRARGYARRRTRGCARDRAGIVHGIAYAVVREILHGGRTQNFIRRSYAESCLRSYAAVARTQDHQGLKIKYKLMDSHFCTFPSTFSPSCTIRTRDDAERPKSSETRMAALSLFFIAPQDLSAGQSDRTKVSRVAARCDVNYFLLAGRRCSSPSNCRNEMLKDLVRAGCLIAGLFVTSVDRSPRELFIKLANSSAGRCSS